MHPRIPTLKQQELRKRLIAATNQAEIDGGIDVTNLSDEDFINLLRNLNKK